jgi:phosphoribosyl-AMP cyclohydrolase / phosphoribosyl-ATP pyrophosphohydrolase
MIPPSALPDHAKYPDGLVPAIVQDSLTGQVLMLGFMNEQALEQTRRTGLVTFFSRSKGRLWTKGESSGHVLRCTALSVDCDRDTLLVQAIPAGPTCHTGQDSCFGDAAVGGTLQRLEATIQDRLAASSAESYTARLVASGMPKVAQKVGEEAVELVIEAMGEDEGRFLNESADLLYHFLVLLAAKGVRLKDVAQVLEERAG